MKIKSYSKVPKQYRDEFLAQETALIKSRVHLFCMLTIGLYFFASLIGRIVYPDEYKIIELFMGLILTAGGVLILYLNHRTKTIRIAKLNAYLFTTLLLVLLARVGVAYADNPLVSSSIFVFTLFLVSMTIPWTPYEIIPLWSMHVLAFTASFLCVRYMPETAESLFGLRQYLDGVIFLTMAFWLCLVVRRKETKRDIENFALLKDVEEKNDEIRKELEWATRIHKTIIPDSTKTDKADIAVSYLPAYYIGGDYVRLNLIGHNKLLFSISDITGHGVPAALLVNRTHAEFERLEKGGKEPGPLLKELDEFIKKDFEGSGMYLSAFCGLVDFNHMQLLYSNYGHPSQYVYSEKGGCLNRLSSQTSLLGLPLKDKAIYQSNIKIGERDKILLFTDGIIETTNKAHEEYGTERVEDFLKRNHSLAVEEFNQKLLEELKVFTNGAFKDDICITSIEIKHHRFLGSKIFKFHN